MKNRLTRINKSKYYKTFFSEHKTNSRQTWEAVRSLINVKIKSNKGQCTTGPMATRQHIHSQKCLISV